MVFWGNQSIWWLIPFSHCECFSCVCVCVCVCARALSCFNFSFFFYFTSTCICILFGYHFVYGDQPCQASNRVWRSKFTLDVAAIPLKKYKKNLAKSEKSEWFYATLSDCLTTHFLIKPDNCERSVRNLEARVLLSFHEFLSHIRVAYDIDQGTR